MTSASVTESVSARRMGMALAVASTVIASAPLYIGGTLVEGSMVENASVSRAIKLPGEEQNLPDRGTAKSLLRFAGAWSGDDLEEVLAEAINSRS